MGSWCYVVKNERNSDGYYVSLTKQEKEGLKGWDNFGYRYDQQLLWELAFGSCDIPIDDKPCDDPTFVPLLAEQMQKMLDYYNDNKTMKLSNKNVKEHMMYRANNNMCYFGSYADQYVRQDKGYIAGCAKLMRKCIKNGWGIFWSP